MALLAGFATVDLGLQAVLVDVAGTLALARAVVPAGALATVAWLASWAMLATFAAKAVPHLFPARLVGTTRSMRFRLPVAGVAIGAGVLLEAATVGGLGADGATAPWAPVSDAVGLQAWTLALLLGGALAVAAAVRASDGRLLGGGFAADLLDAATPFERVEHADLRRLGIALAAVVVAAVALGTFLLVGELLSPLTEVAAVAWGAVWLLGEAGLPVSAPGREWLDVKRRLSLLAAAPAAGTKGLACFLVVAHGLLAGGLAAGATVEMLAVVGGQVLAGTYSSPTLGLFLSVGWVATTTYTLWYWLRMADRLPHFLEEWVGLSPREVVTRREWVDRRPLVARPPGLMVPPMLVWLVINTGQNRVFDRFDGSLPDYFLPGLAVTLLVVAASVALAYRLSPQSPLTDAVALPGALTVQLTLFLLALTQPTNGPSDTMVGLVEYPLWGSPPAGWALEHLALALVGFGLFVALLFYLPDAREQRHRGGGYRLLPGALVLGVGLGMYATGEALRASAGDLGPLAVALSSIGGFVAVPGVVALLAKTSLLVPGTTAPGEGVGPGRYLRSAVLFATAVVVLFAAPSFVAVESTAFGVVAAVVLLLVALSVVDLVRRVVASVRRVLGGTDEAGERSRPDPPDDQVGGPPHERAEDDSEAGRS